MGAVQALIIFLTGFKFFNYFSRLQAGRGRPKLSLYPPVGGETHMEFVWSRFSNEPRVLDFCSIFP